MKVALLLPGYLDSADYAHLKVFDQRLNQLGYTVERIDQCHIWQTRNADNYTITNFIKQIEQRIEFYHTQNPEEIILLGHSQGAMIAIIVAAQHPEITKVIALCPPPDHMSSSHKWKNQTPRISTRDLPNDPSKQITFEIPYAYIEDAAQYSATKSVSHITQPLMILIALADTTVDPALTEQIVVQARNPHVVRVPDLEHGFRRSTQDTLTVWSEIEKFVNQS